MKIRWEVDDGYAGKSRPHYVAVPDKDLEDLSEAEQEAVIEEWVKGEFDSKVSYYWSPIGSPPK